MILNPDLHVITCKNDLRLLFPGYERIGDDCAMLTDCIEGYVLCNAVKKYNMKTQIDELCSGNIISYRGKGRISSKNFAEIKEIKDISDGQMFWFKKRFEDDEEFVGYTNETNGVFLTHEILSKLGFKSIEKGVYTVADITLKSVGEVKGEDSMNLQLISHGWYVIPAHLIVQNEEELKNFVSLKTLHALQNYLKDAGIELDYTVLK